MKKFFLIFLYLFCSSLTCIATDMNDENDRKKQSIIVDKKVQSILPNLPEKDIFDLVQKSFQITTLNVLNEGNTYDSDQISYIQKKTDLRFGLIDQRAGRIVIKYNNSIGFGTGSFIDNKIFTNAHVLEEVPLSSEAIFEQGRSLILRNDLPVDLVVDKLNKYKFSLINKDLYKKDKIILKEIFDEGLYSLYNFNSCYFLEDYLQEKNNSDIGFIEKYTVKDNLTNYSQYSYHFPKSPYVSAIGDHKVYKGTHYPLGLPIQRTSFGIIDKIYDGKDDFYVHNMHSLGGSSGFLVSDYYNNLHGFHSTGPYSFKKEDYKFYDYNIYENLNYLGKDSRYLMLNRHEITSKLFSLTIKNKLTRYLSPIFSLPLKKLKVKMF